MKNLFVYARSSNNKQTLKDQTKKDKGKFLNLCDDIILEITKFIYSDKTKHNLLSTCKRYERLKEYIMYDGFYPIDIHEYTFIKSNSLVVPYNNTQKIPNHVTKLKIRTEFINNRDGDDTRLDNNIHSFNVKKIILDWAQSKKNIRLLSDVEELYINYGFTSIDDIPDITKANIKTLYLNDDSICINSMFSNNNRISQQRNPWLDYVPASDVILPHRDVTLSQQDLESLQTLDFRIQSSDETTNTPQRNPESITINGSSQRHPESIIVNGYGIESSDDEESTPNTESLGELSARANLNALNLTQATVLSPFIPRLVNLSEEPSPSNFTLETVLPAFTPINFSEESSSSDNFRVLPRTGRELMSQASTRYHAHGGNNMMTYSVGYNQNVPQNNNSNIVLSTHSSNNTENVSLIWSHYIGSQKIFLNDMSNDKKKILINFNEKLFSDVTKLIIHTKITDMKKINQFIKNFINLKILIIGNKHIPKEYTSKEIYKNSEAHTLEIPKGVVILKVSLQLIIKNIPKSLKRIYTKYFIPLQHGYKDLIEITDIEQIEELIEL